MSGPPTTQETSSSHHQQASITQPSATSNPASKSPSPAATQEPKLNYAQAAGKATSSSGASTPASQSAAPMPVTSFPAQQNSGTSTPAQPAVAMNGTPKSVMPPTGPAAMNGSMSPQHSRASSTASNYRSPAQPLHSAKPSMTAPPPYTAYPAQIPQIPAAGGRNSPFPEYHEENHRSPSQPRNGPAAGAAMARHGSSSSLSDRQVPQSPRPSNRANVAGQYPYQYANAPPFNYNQGVPGRAGFRNPSASAPFQPMQPQQFQRGQMPRSPQQQNIQMAPQMYPGMQPGMQIPMQPGPYVNPPFPPFPLVQNMDLTWGDVQYMPDQYAQQMAMQGYMMPQQYPQQNMPFNMNAPQMFQTPGQNLPVPFTPTQSRSSPVNHQPMSRSASMASDINHQAQPSATPSPAPKEESPFVKPKKSSAIKIVNPETKTEITFPKVAAAKVPERSPSPAVKGSPTKSTPLISHSPAPSVDASSEASPQKSKAEIAEEMKIKIQKTLEETQKKEAEKAEAERLEAERKLDEERKAEEEKKREEEKKLEEERKAAEELKAKEEAERLEAERLERERKAEEEEAARQAEMERLAAEKKAEEEQAAKIAAEKAEEEAARVAKESETKPVGEAASPAAAADESIAPEERRPSIGGQRKMAPPPLEIKATAPVADGLQSAALKTAAFIKQETFLTTTYPDGFTSPDPAINAKFGTKGFHYNVEFLYQFKDIYKDKPAEDWDVKIKETMGDFDARNQRPMGGRAVSTGPFQMGNFVPNPITRHPSGLPSLSTGPSFGLGSNFTRAPTRNMSQSGQGMKAPSSPSGRAQSKSQRQSSRRTQPQPQPPPEPPVEPLLVNPNRWKPQRAEGALGPPPGDLSKLSPEVVQRKVKSLLNKLTLEKFDKITDQILEIAGQSRTETDGRTLRQIIQLTFEKATDEPNFSEMYALFCRKIMETIDPSITDPNVLNKDGQPLTGGQLFRKYLLNRCQEEFERGWKVNLPPKPEDDAVGKEAELLSEAYYTAAKAKRQGLGLVQFIGELFKLNMLIEKIMYECIIRLLGGTEDPHPEPEEVESLCRLLNTVGKALDEGKARSRMNAIYEALDYIRVHSDLESRIKFKILDVLDLRKAGWVGRATGPTGPKTIQEIHEDAARAKAEAEIARQTTSTRPRQEFGRGDARLEGWNSAPRRQVDNRAGDLSKLGLVRNSSSTGLGPQLSQFNSTRSSSRRGNAAGNILTREGSGQSSRGTTGAATPLSVTSTNSFDIFRNESEARDDNTAAPAPARKQSVSPPDAADDEILDGAYYTVPPIQSVGSSSSVLNFVVVRKNYGQITFKDEVDLTDIPSMTVLRDYIEIRRGGVTVYPKESIKAAEGAELNMPAEISLEGMRPAPGVSAEEYTAELKAKPDTEFVSWDTESGVWVFTVKSFSPATFRLPA